MKSIVDSISDLSLLEISGEDDSLLSDNTSTVTAANVFSCSPLVSARSRPRQIKGSEIDNVASEDLDSSMKDSANKENTKWNKPEGMDSSQKKKRKKKLGGFNLRKSLAWDRAFFTEQGVLNPLELSMISGTVTPNSKSNLNLEVIDEEEPATTSLALQEIEENLFKHSSGGVSIRNRTIGAVSALSPKPGSSIKRTTPVATLAKRKILAVNDVGNKYKRSACPKPVVPSSSTNNVKTPSKESKITRIPGPKSSVSATTTRSGMLSSGSLKRNQNAHPVNNVPKYAGVKGLSKNPRTAPSIPKVDMADKCSIARTLTKQAGKHLDNSVSETRPPSRMHQTGSGANKASEACLPQGISDTDKKKQQTLFQTTKSSGLRMPSPSIGFFSHAKASSSNGQLQKSSIPCKPSESNIPKLRKLGTNSVNEARSKVVQGAAKNRNKELSLSDVKSEPVVQIDNKQMAGVVEVECDSLSFEKISKQAEVKNINKDVMLKSKEQGDLHENDNVSGMENMVFPTHEKEFLTKSHTHEQLEKEADHALDDKLHDVSSNGGQSLYQEPQSTHCPIMQATSNNVSNTVHNAIEQDEDDQIKGPICDISTFKEILVLQADHETSIKDDRDSGEFKEHNSVKTALLNCSLDDFGKTVPEGSKQGIPCKNTEQVNCGAGEFGRFGGDSQVHLLNESLSINCNETTQSHLEAVSQQFQGEQLKTPNPSSVGEIGSEKENMSVMKNSQSVHVSTLFSKGSPEKSILETNGASENESKIAEIKECQLPVDGQSGFIPRSQMDVEYDQVIDSKAIHNRTQEFELDRLSEDRMTVSATACCTNVTNVEEKAGCESGGIDIPVNNSDPISESQTSEDNFSTDTSIHCEVQCDVPGNIEQQASIFFTNPEINEISCEDEILVPNHGHLLHQSEFSADLISNIEDPVGSEAENSSGLLQHTLPDQSVREFDHTYRDIEESHEEDGQAQSFNENPVAYDCNSKHCSAVINDQFSLADDINEDFHLPEFQNTSAVVAVDSQDVHNILQRDGDFLPAITVSSAEIKEQNLVDRAFEECRFDTSEHGASNHQTCREIEESHVEDAQAQSLDENPVADDCRSQYCPAVINDQFSLADDDNVHEDFHLAEFQKPIVVTTVDTQDVNNNILHLDGDFLPTIIVSSAEIKEQSLVDSAFEECRFNTNEHGASNHHTYREIEDSHMEDAQEQSFDENPVAYDCSSKHCPAVINGQFSLADDNNRNEDSHLPELRKPSDVALDFQYVNNILHLDNDCVPTNIASSVEIKEQKLVEGALEGCMFQSNEHNASNHHIQDMPENRDGNLDVDERVELLQIDGAEEGSSDIPSVAVIQLNENVISAEFDSSTNEVSEDPFASLAAEIKEQNLVEDAFERCRFQSNEHSASNNHIQDMPENKVENHDVYERVELLQIDGTEESSSGILPVVEIQLNENVNSAEFDSSTNEVSEDPFASLAAEIKEQNLVEDAFERCRFQSNEHSASNNHIQDMPENKVENHDVYERVELLQIDGTEESSSGILPVVEIQLNENVNSAEFDSSATEVSEDPFASVAACKPEEQCFLSEKSKLIASDNPTFSATIPQGSEVSSMKLNENVISAEFDSSTEVSEDPFTSVAACKSKEQCLFSEKSKSIASDNPTFNATIPQGSEVSSVKLNENDTSAEFESSSEVSEDPFKSVAACKSEEQCFFSEKSKSVASDNPTFNATIPQGSEVSSVKLNENDISAGFESSTEVSEDPFTSVAAFKSEEQWFFSEKSKLLASDIPTFNATVPQGSEVSSVKLNENDISAELDSSTEASEDLFTTVVAWKSEEQCLSSEKSKLPASDSPTFNAAIPQGSEVSSVNRESLSDVAETNIVESDKFPNTDMLCQAKGNIDFAEDNRKIVNPEKAATKSKQEVPIVKPPPNVLPFTEEWLAAIEAAGEEILTMKGGAVQNSPPDKAHHEPSPWSPVKKNQAIGPFDCTKVTKHNIQNSDPS